MQQRRRNRHLRRVLRVVAMPLLAVAMLVVVLEIVLDQTHWFGARRAWVKPDPLLRYRFEPNAPYWFHEENDHAIEGRINAGGWRDRPRTMTKATNVVRVAVLGDSYVEAFHVELDSTFAALAEEAANHLAAARAVDQRFEFLNFGRSGFSQAEEWLVLLHDVPPYQVDLVALFFYPGNDIRDIHPSTSSSPRPYFSLASNGALLLDVSFRDSRNYRVRGWLNPLQRRSALVSLVVARVVTARQSQRILTTTQAEMVAADRVPAYRSLATQSPEPRYARNYDINRRLLARMAEFCRDRGIVFLLVCMPDAYTPETQQTLRGIDASYDPHFFTNDLRQLADSTASAFLDLQVPFENAAQRGEDVQWVHWNYAGHRLVAQHLLDAVLALEPLDR